MAKYRFSTPDGKTYDVEAPDGVPAAKVAAQFKAAVARRQPAPRQPAPRQPDHSAGAQVASFGAGLGDMLLGVGTPVKAAGYWLGARAQGIKVKGQDPSWDQAYEAAKISNAQLFEDNPTAYRVGEGAGLVAGGGVGRVVGGALAKLAPAAATRVGQVLRVAQGQPVRNVARMAAGGAVAGGVTAVNQTGDTSVAVPGAVGGAVLGPIGGAAAGAVQRGVKALSRTAVPSWAAILAKRTGLSSADLMDTYSNLKSAMGHNPNVAELMDTIQAQKVAPVFATHATAAEALLRGASGAANRRSAGMASAISDVAPSDVPTAQGIGAARDARMDRYMSEHRGDMVNVSSDDLAPFIADAADETAGHTKAIDMLPNVPLKAGDTSLRGRLMAALQEAQDNGTATMSLGDLDQMRRIYGNAAEGLRKAPGSVEAAKWGPGFKQLAGSIEAAASKNHESYGDELTAYRQASTAADAMSDAPVATGNDTVADYAASYEHGGQSSVDPEGYMWQQAMAQKAQQSLAEAARRSPEGAVRTAKRLSEDANLQDKLSVSLGPNEASRLQRMGAAEVTAAKNMNALVGSIGVKSSDVSTTQTTQAVAAALSPALSLPYKVFWAAKMVNRFGVRNSTAQALAQNITNPEKVPAVIDYLRRIGIDNQTILSTMHEFSASGGSMAGATAGTQMTGVPQEQDYSDPTTQGAAPMEESTAQ